MRTPGSASLAGLPLMLLAALPFVLLAALAANCAPAAAAELGRLFLTPEQRAALNSRRSARTPDKPPALPLTVAPSARVDGYVTRSGGKSTLWVNGVPLPEGSQPEGLRLLPQRRDSGRVSISVGESEQRYDLKPGQSLDSGEGAVRDVLGNGEIRITRPSAAPR